MNAPTVHSAPTSLTAGQSDALITGLTDALNSERKLIDELTAAMRAQRTAVASDDLQSVDDSVFAVQRILLTLAEARKRRRTLNARLGQNEDIALRDLLDALGPMATHELKGSRDALQSSAHTLAREVTINRQILKEALAAGDEMVRSLVGASPSSRGYGASGSATRPANAAFIVNKRA